MSELFGMCATSSRKALIPSGLLAGPANWACWMCFARYKTGNATQIMVGSRSEDFNIFASSGASRTSLFDHGSAGTSSLKSTGAIQAATIRLVMGIKDDLGISDLTFGNSKNQTTKSSMGSNSPTG